MSVIALDSKTLLSDFIKNESDKTILEASYIIASNRIRFSSKYKDQCQVMFMPPDMVIMKMNDEEDIDMSSNSEYVYAYYEQLKSLRYQIALIIKMTLEEDLLTIILTTKMEDKTFNHLNILRKWVFENFGYKIERYDGSLPDRLSYSKQLEIIDRCNRVIKKEKKKRIKKMMRTPQGQREYFSTLEKKKLKKLLKKEGVYRPGMLKSEMIEVALTFLV